VKDKDRYPLLFGPYRVPAFRSGDEAFCELRGQVVISRTVHEAPIGVWPKGRRRGERAAGIILFGDLVQAVRNEAAATVRYWWGVGSDSIWKWRRALEVQRVNKGTTFLLVRNFLGPAGKRARAAGYPTLKSPERAAKIAAALRGRTMHPNARAALLQANVGRTLSPDTRLRLSLVHRKRKSRPPTNPPDWTKEEDRLVRTLSQWKQRLRRGGLLLLSIHGGGALE
jgi:hypothetical protein